MYSPVSTSVSTDGNTITSVFSRTEGDSIYTKTMVLNTNTPSVSWTSNTSNSLSVLGSISELSDIATEADLVAGNHIVVDTAEGPKRLPADAVAKARDLGDYAKRVTVLVAYKEIPEVLNEGESFFSTTNQIVSTINGQRVFDVPKKNRLYYYDNSIFVWDGNNLLRKDSVYEVQKIVPVSSMAADVIGNFIVYNPSARFFRTRLKADDPSGATYQSLSKNKVYLYKGNCFIYDGQELIPQCDYVVENLDNHFITGNYYVTNGTSVDFNFSANAGFCGCVIKTKAGDIFKVSAVGGNAPRAFAIVDNAGEIVLASALGESVSNYPIFIEEDGFLVVNSTLAGNHHITRTRLRSDKENTKFGFNLGMNQFYSVNTAGNVGDVPSFELGIDKTWVHEVFDVNDGDEFLVYGLGGGNAKLFCFVDRENKIVLTSPSSFNTSTGGIAISAPCDGKLYINALRSSYFSVLKKGTMKEQALKNFEKVSGSYPLADFEHSSDMFNFVGGALQGITFDSGCMQSIYDKFDDLIDAAPHNVTKIDAYEFTGVAKPTYANYDTWMYKISWDNWNKQDDRIGLKSIHKKHRMLIIGGIHGNERGAQANCYIFAENLVKCKNKDYFSLLASYDIYIVPVVNGYGSINDKRTNGNSVNINRNYPTNRWTLTAEGEDYSGPTAGSEQETKMVVKLLELIDPSVALDHHNYYGGNQFYSTPGTFVAAREAYKSLIDISFAAIKNYPQYFGVNHQLIVNPASTLNAALILSQAATFVDYCNFAPNHSLKIFSTVEMNGCISFNNGEPSGNIGGYGSEASTAVGEYMLRAFALRYAEYDLNRTATEINDGYIASV